ncbi:methyltransferase [Macrophomina phaseolina]|uniref:Methyltransferase n=1 Tax=Macrophomina phaseolina TaxID=35725 RepID=A0ABQ8G8D7_9PEZI|nr:methyltransferase [Macrophomina phaseolina]
MAACDTKMMFLEPWSTADRGNPFYRSDPDPGFDVKNFEWLSYPVSVTDARARMSSFTLDDHAFAFRRDPQGGAPDVLKVFEDNVDEQVREKYYPHVIRVVKEATGASEAIVFNHTVRRRDPSLGLFEGSKGRQQPASTVHCDQSAEGAIRRVQQLAEDKADERLKGRCAIINVWRPIKGPVKDWPLAMMDGSTLSPSDVHPTDLWKKQYERLGQTVNICQAEGQQWYYLKDHQVDEVTLIKIWDNEENVPAKLCAHCAFEDPSTPPNAPLRESVEARCLVFY